MSSGNLHRSTVNLLLKKASKAASLPFAAHPHMLRHACGFALADQGADTRLIQDYLGHRKIEHTVKYAATNPARFARRWGGLMPPAHATFTRSGVYQQTTVCMRGDEPSSPPSKRGFSSI